MFLRSSPNPAQLQASCVGHFFDCTTKKQNTFYLGSVTVRSIFTFRGVASLSSDKTTFEGLEATPPSANSAADSLVRVPCNTRTSSPTGDL